MCRRHVQHGSPKHPKVLESLTDNYLGHPGDAWCNLQHNLTRVQEIKDGRISQTCCQVGT